MTVRVDLEAIRGNLRVVRSLAGARAVMACTMSTFPDPSAKGSIVELGTPAEILDRPKDPTLKEFLRRMR